MSSLGLGRAFLGRLGLAPRPTAPAVVNWDLTYACPLRCGHCYSDSGRRSARQLPLESLMRIADEILQIRPLPRVTFTGGEPLLVRGFLDVARRLKQGGAVLTLYTSGFRLKAETAFAIGELFDRVAVSLDGPDAAMNDFLRERPGAYDEALRAARSFDDLKSSGAQRFSFGFEITILRTNWGALDRFAKEIAPSLPHLDYLHYGALIPTGLASRESFVDRELLSDEQMAELPALERRLRRIAPRSVHVRVFSNLPFAMHPKQLRRGLALDDLVKIEADGRLRGMDIYEGTVGSVLEEPFSVLFPRTLQRHRHPFVVEQLSAVQSMRDWAAACRAIDLHFAAREDRARIVARELAIPLPSALRPAEVPAARRPRKLDLLSC